MVAIGAARDFSLPGVPLEVVPWSEAGELASLRTLDVGVMPLPDSPWERGKCGFKLIQYMAAALPVVASPVGANRDIVVDGETGFLAGSQDQWLDALRTLRASADLRDHMGRAGRRRVEGNYSVQAITPRLLDVLAGASGFSGVR
jgi:glycosyltransferase involved in cell wall biosynthesis